MKLRTLIPVSYNNGITSQTNGIVEGTILGANEGFRFGYSANFSFEYKTLEGQLITSGGFPLTEDEVNGLYEIVKDEVPNNLSYTQSTNYLYLLGMRVKMAETFGITINEIELVIE